MDRLRAIPLAALIMAAAPALAEPTVAQRVESNDKIGALSQCAGLFDALADHSAALTPQQRANARKMRDALAALAGKQASDLTGHSARYAPLVQRLGNRDPQRDPTLAPDLEACAWITMSVAQ